MAKFEGLADAATAVIRWLVMNEEFLDDRLRERLARLTEAGASPVDVAAQFVETVYANPAEFDEEARELAADVSVVTEAHGFYGHHQAQRGARIRTVLLGQRLAKSKHPEPLAGFQLEAP